VQQKVSVEQIQILCVIQFANQLSNGGFLQYFWNSEAKNIDDLMKGLKLTSNEKVLGIVSETWRKTEPKMSYLIEQKRKYNLDSYDEVANHFGFLSDLEQKAYPQYEIYDKAIEYVRNNPALFTELTT
jgi:hypothetical protein